MPFFVHRLCEMEQGRDNLQASLINTRLAAQRIDQLYRTFVCNVQALVNSLDTQPDGELMSQLLEDHHIFVVDEDRGILARRNLYS